MHLKSLLSWPHFHNLGSGSWEPYSCWWPLFVSYDYQDVTTDFIINNSGVLGHMGYPTVSSAYCWPSAAHMCATLGHPHALGGTVHVVWTFQFSVTPVCVSLVVWTVAWAAWGPDYSLGPLASRSLSLAEYGVSSSCVLWGKDRPYHFVLCFPEYVGQSLQRGSRQFVFFSM